jgi:N-acetyl-anhydromuramyl-L-alanine amidase AmpD
MIDTHNFILSDDNFYKETYKKKYIVIGNSFNTGMNHFYGWRSRSNGSYKNVSHFTINVDGTIHQHFDTKYYSDFLRNSLSNKNVISITLVNQGWFDYDIMEKSFINYIGNSYSGTTVERRWRNHSFWEPYSDKQVNSLIYLSLELIKEFDIPKNALSHNTFVKEMNNVSGISYRSNWTKDCTDLSPSFDFEIFKNKIEDNGL